MREKRLLLDCAARQIIWPDDLPALAKFSPTIQLSRQAPLSGRIDPKIQADAERRNRLLEKEEKRYRILHKNWRRSDQAPPASVPTRYRLRLRRFSPSLRLPRREDPEHVACVRSRLPPQLTHLEGFFSKKEAHTLPSSRPGHDVVLELEKPLSPTGPPSYRTPVKYLPLEKETVDHLREIDFIEPDPSPHAASVLFAPKPNTTARRFCIDYRWMNDHLKSRITPAPSLEGTAFGCREAQRFTKIDVIQAFHRLRMDPDSEYLTAFRTRFGTFRWKVLPFGLKVGPAWFQQFINAQLHDLLDRCASAYADDVLIYSDKEEDHWKDCQEVIWRLHQANLQGDIKKSRFNVTKVDYLGVLLEAGVGLSVDPRKVRSIQDWKFEDLRDRTAIRSFVGLCNFIRVFCYHASGVAEPLNRSGWRSIQFHQFGLTIELR
ncbi:reverse transcriptase (RNA-dependent DNA polymerase) domain-containing protein [Hirsutella rhossiliensis]|uniref:Reverse transcriptase (RNA-dependent DNA polymerase) domain-containing protein n=1 Tax=Hirsutella rhossiliensis TaxID=111463 RepID=A0A9P8MSL5_9HYPO|nr:reverse transcriptase (RNA-dependent DNA polymerase) domain-containing protein [Hirsutella rhossiliensis]KAH0958452.1 reverse transcriptase (RNA-dependent DNA polymerase) domain-containing protein [Hirsutella rhossiliensis]